MVRNFAQKALMVTAALLVFCQMAVTVQAASLTLEDAPQNPLKTALHDKFEQGLFFVLGINEKLKTTREEFQLLQKNIGELEGKIEVSKVRIENLESQLSNMDRLIKKNQARVLAGLRLKAEYENQMLQLAQSTAEKKESLGDAMASLDRIANAWYVQTSSFFDTESEAPKLLAFLGNDDSHGDILQQQQYLSILQRTSMEMVGEVIKTEDALEAEQKQMEQKQKILDTIQTFLTREERSLTESKASRERLLAETKGKQAIYEALLKLAKTEEEQVSVSIKRLKENYEYFQAKLDELKLHPELADINVNAFSLIDEKDILKGSRPLAWPVSPSLGISAYFHDEAYQAALGVGHNAIDIRITQGSKIMSAADGVVSKVADNGFGYSYIIVAHADKILTLYGHVSEILVQEGEIVRQGQAIGLSGGIPGTKGAGWLTTGAHLHFEVFKDFVHVDPLYYLPLEYLPIGTIPEKYVKELLLP